MSCPTLIPLLGFLFLCGGGASITHAAEDVLAFREKQYSTDKAKFRECVATERLIGQRSAALNSTTCARKLAALSGLSTRPQHQTADPVPEFDQWFRGFIGTEKKTDRDVLPLSIFSFKATPGNSSSEDCPDRHSTYVGFGFPKQMPGET